MTNTEKTKRPAAGDANKNGEAGKDSKANRGKEHDTHAGDFPAPEMASKTFQRGDK